MGSSVQGRVEGGDNETNTKTSSIKALNDIMLLNESMGIAEEKINNMMLNNIGQKAGMGHDHKWRRT